MFDFSNKKAKRIMVGAVAILIVVCMILPTILAAIMS